MNMVECKDSSVSNWFKKCGLPAVLLFKTGGREAPASLRQKDRNATLCELESQGLGFLARSRVDVLGTPRDIPISDDTGVMLLPNNHAIDTPRDIPISDDTGVMLLPESHALGMPRDVSISDDTGMIHLPNNNVIDTPSNDPISYETEEMFLPNNHVPEEYENTKSFEDIEHKHDDDKSQASHVPADYENTKSFEDIEHKHDNDKSQASRHGGLSAWVRTHDHSDDMYQLLPSALSEAGTSPMSLRVLLPSDAVSDAECGETSALLHPDCGRAAHEGHMQVVCALTLFSF